MEEFDIISNLDAYAIQQYQQNRYPLLFIDKVVEVKPGEYVKAYKNFTYNEWFFPAHFADEPNVPGFVQVESLAQTFIMSFLTIPEHKGKKTAFLEIKDFKFRRQIIPGDRVDIEAHLDSFKRGVAKGYVEARVDGEFAYSGYLKCGLPDVMKKYIPISKEK